MCFASRYNVVDEIRLLKHKMHCSSIINGVAPVSFCFEVPNSQLSSETEFYAGYGARSLSADKFKTSSRTLVIEQNPTHSKQPVGFSIISRKMKSGDFADAVRASWLEQCGFLLRYFAHVTEHFTRPGKVELAFGSQFS